MSKAVEKAVEFDDEEGAAESAAALGPDGGPVVSARIHYQETDEDVFFDETDDAWLDEELSDEELAALGEEDFDDDDALGDLDLLGELGGDEAVQEALEDGREIDLAGAGADAALATAFDEDARDVEGLVEDEDRADASPAPGISAIGAVSAAGDETETFDDPSSEEIDHRPVPRISIHAFCESPRLTALLEKAAVDRRLAKTHLTVHMGGLPKAIDHFQNATTPNLILIETLDGGERLFAQLGELAEVCDPSTKVIIIGDVNDIKLYRELMNQGVSDYIVQPQSPLHLIKAIAELYIDPSAPPIGKTIAFVGARGGVGSSTIAHNVAWSAAEEYESDTVILDLDLPFGTASLDFEQDPTSGLVEALSSPERLDDVLLDRLLQKHTDRLSLFTAPNLLDRDYDLDDQAFETVIDVVRGAAPTIVVDVPHVWTGWSKRLLQTADEIVITAAPDLASFRNTKNLVDIISGARPNDASPTLVLNQFDPKVSSVQSEQFVEHVGITPAAVIGWEPQLFHAAATNAAPIIEVGEKTKTAQALREIAALVLGRQQTVAKKSKFSISGLFKK